MLNPRWRSNKSQNFTFYICIYSLVNNQLVQGLQPITAVGNINGCNIGYIVNIYIKYIFKKWTITLETIAKPHTKVFYTFV